MAAKIKLHRSENHGLSLSVENCVLLPIEDYLSNRDMRSRRLFCPVVNVIMEFLYKIGIDCETRSWNIGTMQKSSCLHVIGIMDEVAKATELKAGQVS